MRGDDVHDLRDRHLYLTGGTGSVGRTLIDYLARCHAADRGPHVTILTRDPEAFRARYPLQAGHAWLRLVIGDLAGLPALPADTTDIIHAAADTHRGGGHAAWADQIVGGTRTVIDAALALSRGGVAMPRFLLVSSGAIYGPQPASLPLMPETYGGAPDPLLPESTYGQAKRMAEQLCTIAGREQGLVTVIARLFAFGSAHTPRDGRYALGNFVRDALARDDRPITVAGDGRAIRSYLGGNAMASALMAALVRGEPNSAYNIGSEEPVTIGTLAHRVRDRLSPARDVIVQGAPGDGQRSRYVPDVSRIGQLGAPMRDDLDRVIDEVASRAD